jgi:hypothetical protein
VIVFKKKVVFLNLDDRSIPLFPDCLLICLGQVLDPKTEKSLLGEKDSNVQNIFPDLHFVFPDLKIMLRNWIVFSLGIGASYNVPVV